nr:hypothetical protein [Neisseria uirgultaei]
MDTAIFLVRNNGTTQGTCKGFCYPHSSYFAEVPEQYQRDKNGNIKMENGKNFKEIRYKKGTVESVISQLNL